MSSPKKADVEALPYPMPRGPVFSWSNFSTGLSAPLRSAEDLPNRLFTTSGRAAIYQALLQLRLAPGDVVLVPTYHCPTMVAPVLLAGGCIDYFGIGADGLPNLDNISSELARRAVAILVPHYFGLAQSLSKVRSWCDAHGIALIEDCAHSLFGEAGDRQVGAWGNFASASLSKFLPVPEGGLLVSNMRPLHPIKLQTQSFPKQIKGIIDVLYITSQHQRLAGFNLLLAAFFKLKASIKRQTKIGCTTPDPAKIDFMADCDMGRITMRPLLAAKLIDQILPRAYIIDRRRENYQLYTKMLGPRNTSALIKTHLPEYSAPYVFPFWVEENSDHIYHSLRLAGYPVFRWDRIWPGTPALDGDVGPRWSRHVLQLLCHQDLSLGDISKTAAAVLRLLDADIGNDPKH